MKNILLASIFLMSVLFSYSQNCPTLTLTTASYGVVEGDTLLFVAQVGSSSVSPTYNWVISNGKIVSGQGTPVLKVLTDSLGGTFITATVELGKVPRECVTSSSATVEVIDAAEKIISSSYTTPAALSAPIKKFITQTNLKDISISQTAFVYVYSGATTTAAQLKAINTAISKEFEKNGILSFQYKIANGGKKKTASYEIYKLVGSNPEPKPSK